MPLRFFDDYRFCPASLELSYRGVPVKLRPKTAVILRCLLARPGELIDKPELLEAAWGARWVADQNLFQAISELRGVLAPLKPIVTYPNRGYAWTLPVRVPATGRSDGYRRRGPVVSMAGALAGVVAAMLFASAWIIDSRVRADPRLPLAPSIRAFQLGISTLSNEPGRAADFFRLALREDPAFAEAQLMLAQSLYLSGRLDQARAEAQHLYLKAVDGELDYLQVSVMGLLSRLDEAAGQVDPALDWAQSAWEKAREKGFACAASEARRRLVDLMAENVLTEQRLPEAPLPDQPPGVALAEQNRGTGCDPLLGVSDPFSAAEGASDKPAEGGWFAV